MEQIAPARRFQVERDASLSGVIADEVEAVVRIRPISRKRSDQPGRFAARRLNLDDVGAEVREDLSARESRFIAEIENSVGG